MTGRPVLSLLGVTGQKVTFLLLVAAHSSLCVPLLGLPGNYSQRDDTASARELFISAMSCKQLTGETLGVAREQNEGALQGELEALREEGIH